MKTFILANANIAGNCFAYIEKLVGENLNSKNKVLVTVGIDDKQARTKAQNRLYWLWVAVIANWQGVLKDECHIMLKRKFLAPILARRDGELAKTFKNVKDCEDTMPKAKYETLANGVASLLSTTKLSTNEMTEYLNDIERYFTWQGVRLPIPAELEWVRGQ